ncbi:MAG: hypothetical protein JXA78_11065 [Anaerolineales bacterium]|nr:hypothetical protein [Anaerolineales bacterium]
MKRSIWIAIGAALLLLVVGNALAAGGFNLAWWTADSGGGASSSAEFNLSGAVGQADAGGSLSGGDYRLTGGFWSAGGQAAQQTHKVYLPLVTR